MYLSAAATRAWTEGARAAVESRPGLSCEVAVLPTFCLLESTAEILSGSPVGWGAQDVAPSAAGAQTGEVGAAVLAELGCRYVEIAHAERRTLFGEDDQMIANKLRQTIEHGMTPLFCVGESTRGTVAAATADCLHQLWDALALTAAAGAPLVIAYEPHWAIGAREPAPADHIRAVCRSLRTAAAREDVRVIYGGSAGPGTYASLHPDVDGVFLGRFAHDVANLAAILDEVESQKA